MYTLPIFNLAVNIFRNGNPPPATPDVSAMGNLAASWRGQSFIAGFDDGTGWSQFYVYRLLLPKNTDVRMAILSGGTVIAGSADWVEVPAGSGLYFSVRSVQVAGGGFANEHLVALISYTLPFTQPSSVVF